MSAKERKQSTRAGIGVSPRARARDDRAGDPLDGLVNLFDLGIVLSVAFLLAALSSLDLTSALTSKSKVDPAARRADAVVANKNQQVKELKLEPGQRVVGHGKPMGTLYRLSDGRTVLVPANAETDNNSD